MRNKMKDIKKDPSEKMLDELVQDIFISSIDGKFKNNSDTIMEKLNEFIFTCDNGIESIDKKINAHKNSFVEFTEELNSTTDEIKSSLTSISLEEEKRHQLVQEILNSKTDEINKQINKLQEDAVVQTDKVIYKIDDLVFTCGNGIKKVDQKINAYKNSFVEFTEELNSTTDEIKSSLTSISLEEEKRHQLIQENLNSKTDEINRQVNKLQEDAIVQNDKIICKVKESDVLLVENKKEILENINLLKNYLDTHFNEIRKELINKADDISYEHNAYFDKELTHLAEILTSKSEEHKHLLECHINDGVYLIEENLLQYLKERDRKVDEKNDKLGNKIEEKQLISNDIFLISTEKSKQERENIITKIAYNDKKSKNRFLFLNIFLVIQTVLIIFLILKQYGLLN